jgi:hypothetical protein
VSRSQLQVYIRYLTLGDADVSKPKNRKTVEYLKKSYKATEAAKLSGVHPNTINKINKHLKQTTS